MKFKNPIARPYATVQMSASRRTSTIKKSLARRFHFLVVWRKAIAKRLRKFGAAIVRVSPPWLRAVGTFIKRPFVHMTRSTKAYLKRRPHRSFRLTRRRDYKRSLVLPGYWSFTNQVRAMLWKNKRLFGCLIAVYFLVTLAIYGFSQQIAYANLSGTLSETGSDVFKGNWGKIAEAGLLLVTSITTGLTPDVTEAQTVLGGLTVFFAWLATVWALRNIMAGRSIRARDAIYSSGSPVLPTVIVAFFIAVQLLPGAIALLVYNTAIATGFIEGGVEGMAFWIAIVLLGALSLYWITSTVIALVVVTLPGMYPFQAIRTAGDLVIGRRVRILFRILWAALLTVILWLLILIPVILLDEWIKKAWTALEWIPIVPVALLLMSATTVVSLAAYIYMLYRKVVDDDAKPA